ncbi:MAG TPA: hypothetical protein VF444_14830 [Pseudonocardiaceae bacterium]
MVVLEGAGVRADGPDTSFVGVGELDVLAGAFGSPPVWGTGVDPWSAVG